ncbi:PAS domain S-box protein [Candidatus Nitrospira bockiana]
MLPARDELLRLILDTTTDLVEVLDPAGRRIFCNHAYRAILGTSESLLGTDAFREVHPHDRDRMRALFTETIRTGIGKRAEYRLVLPDARVRVIESQGSVARDAAGSVTSVVVVARDITERKRAEEALHRSDHWLRAILTHDPACVMVVDREGLIQEINPAGFVMLDAAAEADVIGHSILPLIAEEDRERFSRMAEGVLAGRAGALQFRLETGRRQSRWVDAKAVPFGDVQGKPLSVLMIARDITAARRLEAELQQALNLATVGRLAGRVAHDLNNLLTGIAGRSDLLSRQLSDDSPLRRHAEEIKHACTRCAALTHELLAFGRDGGRSSEAMAQAVTATAVGATIRPMVSTHPIPIGLVVDDDPAVRGVVREALRLAGFEVLEATDGQAALALCDRHAGQVALLLTGVAVPHVRGRELARRLSSRYPAMRTILMSGEREEDLLSQAALQEGMTVLAKPFTVQALEQKIHEVFQPIRT